MKADGGVDVQIHIFLTSPLAGGEFSASLPGLFTPGERAPGTHWIRDWVDPRAGLDDLEKRKFLTIPGLELWPLSRPARSQSLYRLSYPGFSLNALQIYTQLQYEAVLYRTSSNVAVYTSTPFLHNQLRIRKQNEKLGKTSYQSPNAICVIKSIRRAWSV
jgi:hypothetical protein